MHQQPTTTGIDLQLLGHITSILELASSEPGNYDEVNELLYALEDKAKEAYRILNNQE